MCDQVQVSLPSGRAQLDAQRSWQHGLLEQQPSWPSTSCPRVWKWQKNWARRILLTLKRQIQLKRSEILLVAEWIIRWRPPATPKRYIRRSKHSDPSARVASS